jgi:hypothetical protein
MVQCCARVIQKCNQKSSSRSCLQTMWDSYYCYLESLIFLYIRFRVYGTSHKGAQGFVLHCHSWDFRLFSVSMYLGLNESISTGNLIFIRLISQVLFNLTFHIFISHLCGGPSPSFFNYLIPYILQQIVGVAIRNPVPGKVISLADLLCWGATVKVSVCCNCRF